MALRNITDFLQGGTKVPPGALVAWLPLHVVADIGEGLTNCNTTHTLSKVDERSIPHTLKIHAHQTSSGDKFKPTFSQNPTKTWHINIRPGPIRLSELFKIIPLCGDIRAKPVIHVGAVHSFPSTTPNTNPSSFCKAPPPHNVNTSPVQKLNNCRPAICGAKQKKTHNIQITTFF